MKKVLLSEANISEGKNLELVEKVVDRVRSVAEVKILDLDSDPDHNRSVITFLGEPEPVLEAAKGLAEEAIQRIDMTKHKGSHPRMGSLDVAPFVPVRGVEKEEALEIARRFGRYVGDELGVPVYYYEDAATRPAARKTARYS